jgi:hypothetical protein
MLAKNTADVKAKTESVVKVKKVKGSSDAKNTASLMNIISTQQKMLENQQRQTDALLGLTERLIDRVSLRSESNSSPKSSPTPPFRPAISHTPRKRQHLVHYKDRLNN